MRAAKSTMPPVSFYSDPEHNQAIQDQELTFLHYAVVANDGGYLKSSDVCANWNVLQAPNHRILPLFHASDAEWDEVTWVESFGPDAWVFCMSDLLTPRLFSDFDADACVILSREKFEARICDALRPLTGKKLFAHGHVNYADPFGTYQEPMHPPQVHICYGAKEDGGKQHFRSIWPRR